MNPHFTIYFGRFPRTNSALKMKKKKIKSAQKREKGWGHHVGLLNTQKTRLQDNIWAIGPPSVDFR